MVVHEGTSGSVTLHQPTTTTAISLAIASTVMPSSTIPSTTPSSSVMVVAVARRVTRRIAGGGVGSVALVAVVVDVLIT